LITITVLKYNIIKMSCILTKISSKLCYFVKKKFILCYLAIFFPALITQLIPNGVYASSWMVTSRPPGCKITSESEPQDAVKHVIFTVHRCPSHRTYFLLDLTWDSYMPIGQICYQVQVLTKITLKTLSSEYDDDTRFFPFGHSEWFFWWFPALSCHATRTCSLVLLNSMPLLSGCLDLKNIYIYQLIG
jgi:hypothetical protein